MYRFLTISLLLLVTLGLRAQEVYDRLSTIPDDSEIASDSLVTAMAPEVTDTLALAGSLSTPKSELPGYMLRSVFRSWRRSHPMRPLSRIPAMSDEARQITDSLVAIVRNVPVEVLNNDMLYLYDMRLPLINSGSVPVQNSLQFFEDVQKIENSFDTDELPIPHYDEPYLRQRRNEEQRHWVRYQYAASDPRRFRYARRNFDVPTHSSRTFDTKTSVQQTRIADDLDMDFSNASLEAFGQSIVLKADKWHMKGDHSLQMQQTALSGNWYQGGDNNMSVSSQQKLTITRYDEDAITAFETVLDLKLSGFYTKADTVHSMKVSDNEFTLSTKFGYKAWKKWYYSAQLYAKTPIFDYYSANSRECKSTFLSPLELNLSLGVDYQYTSPNKRFTYSLLLAPLSYDLKAVKDDRVNVTSYGIKEGDATIHKFGSSITTKFDWKMSDNASWSSRLYYFTSYNSLKVEFENTFNFRISRFFTAKVYAYPRFDDSRDIDYEAKEMLTLGFSYQW